MVFNLQQLLFALLLLCSLQIIAFAQHDEQATSVSFISLERSGCDSSCPVYKVSLFSDGKVVFKGRRYVAQLGQAKGSVCQVSFKQLAQELASLGFFASKDNYTPATDQDAFSQDKRALSMITVTVKSNGKVKSVSHDIECNKKQALKELIELEKKIEEAADTNPWIEGEPQQRQEQQ